MTQSLIDVFARHLQIRPEAVLYRCLTDGDPTRAQSWSYAETYRRAAAVARLVADEGLAGERVLLLHAPGLDYVAAFLGCLLARAVAVPAYPPDPLRLAQTLPRVAAIARVARVRAVITAAALREPARAALGDGPLARVPWLATDGLAPDPDERWLAGPAADALAYLQFTSGSTSEPKGVRITHGNVLDNSRVIRDKFGNTSSSTGVSWLPPYHDMGLIGGILQPLFVGGSVALMSPSDFLKRPMRWLEAISTFGASTSGGPDFAYELCAMRPLSPSTRLDLSRWRVAFTGAEPIRAQTLDRFADVMAPFGFDRRAFYPCYGLAEATLFATGSAPLAGAVEIMVERAALGRGIAEPVAPAALGRGIAEPVAPASDDATAPDDSAVSSPPAAPDTSPVSSAPAAHPDVRPVPTGAPQLAVRLVSSGSPASSHEVAIVSQATGTRVPDRTVGEIWLSGASIADGYWESPAATAETFGVRIVGEPDAGPYLRTGDLGFIADGQLYVTGRCKDVIIVRGRNHYPQDLEQTLSEVHPAVRPRSCVAYPIASAAGESLGVAIEVRGRDAAMLDAVVTAVRAALATHHDLSADEVALLVPRTLPKTSSGKPTRSATRDGIADGSIATLLRWRRGEPTVNHEASALNETNALTGANANHGASGSTGANANHGASGLTGANANHGASALTGANANHGASGVNFASGLVREPGASSAAATLPAMGRAEIRSWLLREVSERTGLAEREIDSSRPLVEYGLDSKGGVAMAGALEELLGRPVQASLVWDHPSVDAIAAHLAGEAVAAGAIATSADQPTAGAGVAGAAEEPIAIVAMACRFPGGVDSPEALWRLLCSGQHAVTEVPEDRWDRARFYDPRPGTPGRMTTQWGGFVDGIDRFDAAFFGISPREADSLDPRQRLLLEVSWEALERAGLATAALDGSSTGVFIGLCGNDYYQRLAASGPLDARYALTGNIASIAAGRLAYALGLLGPAIAVDTACSSSLVAVHLACQSLRSRECAVALAGGANLVLAPEGTVYFSAMHAMSPTGRCAAFDDSADGYVRSDGCGAIVLKRLSDARRDGDEPIAIIRGSALNHDGRSNGLTAPNGQAQQAVIRQALARAGVAPEQVSYVETHGTGTPLGDPIEAAALGAVFGPRDRERARLCLGSVKSNLGHTEAAAGIAGLMKTALALQHEALPPTLHFKAPNPRVDWHALGIDVVAAPIRWPRAGAPRFAGVSSFGFSGTNAHVVLEEAPLDCAVAETRPGITGAVVDSAESSRQVVADSGLTGAVADSVESSRQVAAGSGLTGAVADSAEASPRLVAGSGLTGAVADSAESSRQAVADSGLAGAVAVSAETSPQLVALAAQSPAALDAMAAHLAAQLRAQPQARLCDVAFTLATRRKHFRHRAAIVASSTDELREALERLPPSTGRTDGRLAFVFSGQGSQRPGMGRELAERFASFAQDIERCDRLFVELSGLPRSLCDVMWADPGTTDAAQLGRTEYTQSAIFAVGYALFRLCTSIGVTPDRVAGHSVGEIVAACAAGAMSFDDAMRFTVARGLALGALDRGGGMLAVQASEHEVNEALATSRGDRSVAAVLDGDRGAAAIDGAGLCDAKRHGSSTFGQPVVAAINGPEQLVVSGSRDALRVFAAAMIERGVRVTELDVSHAFHSPLVEPAVPALRAAADRLRLSSATRLVSTVTGQLADASMTHGSYWVDQVRLPVRFADAARTLASEGVDTYLELGASPVLLPHIVADERHACLRRGRSEVATFLAAIGACYRRGTDIDWEQLVTGRRVMLPTYPFQRRSYGPAGGWPGPPESLRVAPAASRLNGHTTTAHVTSSMGDDRPSAHTATGNGHDPATVHTARSTAEIRDVPVLGGIDQRAVILSALRAFVGHQLRLDPVEVRIDVPLIELGADSLVFVETGHLIERSYGVKIAAHQLFDELPTLEALATFIAREQPAEVFGEPSVSSPAKVHGEPSVSSPPRRTSEPLVSPPAKVHGEPSVSSPPKRTSEPSVSSPAKVHGEPSVSSPPKLASEPLVSPPVRSSMESYGQRRVEPRRGADGKSSRGSDTSLRDIVDHQLRIMEQQLQLLGAAAAAAPPMSAVDATPEGAMSAGNAGPDRAMSAGNAGPDSAVSAGNAGPDSAVSAGNGELDSAVSAGNGGPDSAASAGNAGPDSARSVGSTRPDRARPSAPASTTATHHRRQALSPEQRVHLDDLVAAYVARTAGSKRQAEAVRPALADRRAAAGFTLDTKELLYPIVGASGSGSRLIDIDGNDYIDLAMGFGVHLFGHCPAFVHGAVQQQLDRGMQIGPQSELAGEVATRICALTGMERVTFCNTGTEAVMTALRLARATTGRSRVVQFKGSYHGHFDGTLALGGVDGTVAMAPGVPAGFVEDVLVLDYGDRGSLEAIDRCGSELAAVLVEPVQSRRPDHQPHAFLRELRRITERHGTALVFDEVITGFRIGAAGAQGVFGVRADLSIYGKLLGGGLPIGVVAGAARFMDRIDGGAWQYGDASGPSSPTTFFAGTFSKNPLTMAAARAVLDHIARHADTLYPALERRGERLANALDRWFADDGVGLRVARCGSILRLAPTGATSQVSYLYEPLELTLLYHHLIARGVYVWEGRTIFLSSAHSDDDVDRVIEAVMASVKALRSGGFFGGASSMRAPALAASAAAPIAAAVAPMAAAVALRAPLSWGQEGLWFLSQLEGAAGAYNLPCGVQLTGALDPELLEAAIGEVVARHGALRTTFATEGEGVVQVVAPAARFALTRIDWTRMAAGEQPAAIRTLSEQQARMPFDLSAGPLMRATLVQLAADRWVLLATLHHIIADGWSLAIFVGELSKIYDALARGRRSPLPPLSLQYAEHAAADRARDLAPSLAYWREQLSGAPTSLELPIDRPRPATHTDRSAGLVTVLDAEQVEGLRALGRASGTTLYMTLLGVFALLLHRLTGQDDLIIGSPVTDRGRAELRGLIGFFVNTVALRFRFGREASAKALLRHVREVALAAYAHQDAPFDQVVKAVQPPRLPGRHPFFQAWFNMDVDAEATSLSLADVAVEVLDESVDAPTQVDLSLVVQLRRGELVLKWLHDARLFDRERIEAMALQFAYLARQLAATPERPTAEMSLVPPAHAEQLPDPDAPISRPRYPSVIELFGDWAERAPDQPAIACGDEVWSYAQLRDRARAIAAALQGRAGAVALSGPPTPGLVAGFVGVMMSGRVVVPIDGSLPAARRALMIREAGVTELVDVRPDGLDPSLGAGRLDEARVDGAREDAVLGAELESDVDVLMVDPRTGALRASPELSGALPDEPGGDAPAYVFYTSGTTGTPKGIVGTRAGIAQFVAWQRATFAVGPGDRVSQLTRLSFDAILRDLFLPLTSGATLCIPPAVEQTTTLAWLAAARVTIVHTVPSLAEHWLRIDDAATQLPHVRLALLSGEPLSSDLVRRWRLVAPDCEVVNLYGPTETTMTKCFYRVPAQLADGPQPAGWPLPDTAALVVGPGGRRCGIGEIGEIVLRTGFATLGYLGASEDQAARFERTADGVTTYRTGDRGRYRVDGCLEVLGRADRQVKLRGVRIELGEVEAALRRAGAPQAVALVTDGAAADRRLVAFVLPGHAAPAAAELRARLAAQVPEWMVPSAIIEVEVIPLTPSGKTDAAALLARLTPARAARAAAPGTALERLIHAQFEELLGARVGIDDNFFELGGHSLLAAQLATRLRRATNLPLGLRTLFENPTVAGIARHLEAIPGAAPPSVRSASSDAGHDTELIEL